MQRSEMEVWVNLPGFSMALIEDIHEDPKVNTLFFKTDNHETEYRQHDTERHYCWWLLRLSLLCSRFFEFIARSCLPVSPGSPSATFLL